MRVLGTIGAAALVIALAACGSGESVSSTTTTTKVKAPEGPDLSSATFTDLTGQASPTVQARDNDFVAQYVTVKAGATVTFTNKGRNQHDVIPVKAGAFEGAEPDDFTPGTSITVTFAKPGDYPYYCTLHGTKAKGMVGAVRVVGA